MPLPTEQEWPRFKSLYDKLYPQGIWVEPLAVRQQGSLENFFAALPEPQKELADSDTIDMLKLMFKIIPA